MPSPWDSNLTEPNGCPQAAPEDTKAHNDSASLFHRSGHKIKAGVLAEAICSMFKQRYCRRLRHLEPVNTNSQILARKGGDTEHSGNIELQRISDRNVGCWKL
jgi:hypothetical protein